MTDKDELHEQYVRGYNEGYKIAEKRAIAEILRVVVDAISKRIEEEEVKKW